jgi:hypothetical protein
MKYSGAFALIFFLTLITASAEGPARFFGVLQGTQERARQGAEAGWNVAVIPVSWDRFEPEEGHFNLGEAKRLKEEAKAYRELGYRLQLDLGFQYSPKWIFGLPSSRFRNQFGEEHKSGDPGREVANAVFNQAVRDRMAAYMEAVFREVGADWDWVRLGGGFYGEVNFPIHRFAGKTNCYWAFDDLAQGKVMGLPDGIAVCPVPGWKPGDQDEASARSFLEWYLGAQQNYHDWQIKTARRWYSGDLCMLYGSWGIRPGWKEKAIATCLDGSSSGEAVGELSSGYDWERVIGGIRDPRVIVYCTWLDAPRKDCNDDGADAVRWSPVHWQSSLAEKNPLRLRVWGENTGRGDRDALKVTFERMRRYRLMGVLWAFESDLFADPALRYATFAEYAAEISALEPAGAP